MRDQRARAENRAPEARPLLSSAHAASCGRAFLCPFSCLSPYPQKSSAPNGAQRLTTGNVMRTWMPRERETGISPRARPLQSATLRRGSWKRGLQDLEELSVNLSTMMDSMTGIAIIRRRCFQKNTARMQNCQASADVVRMLCGCLNPNIRTLQVVILQLFTKPVRTSADVCGCLEQSHAYTRARYIEYKQVDRACAHAHAHAHEGSPKTSANIRSDVDGRSATQASSRRYASADDRASTPQNIRATSAQRPFRVGLFCWRTIPRERRDARLYRTPSRRQGRTASLLRSRKIPAHALRDCGR